ncbi:hypothetical protein V3C99_014950 [Haemonchus contortus]
MARRGKSDDQIKHLEPTVNRFAEDTSMLGFRYLHTRYKTWFRLLWALVLTFFVGLTVYQVCERIAYYFIRNPLTTQRSYESPQQMQFPSIGICNKMQLRAAPLAAQEPELVRLLSMVYDDDGNLSTNRSLLDALHMFDKADVLALHKAAYQKVEDLFLSCEIGKSGSCMEDIQPMLTPQGLCFTVSPNMTVRRPGPETTLSLLLNLEVYEIIPGTVIDAGLSRYHQYCGRRDVGPFSSMQYSRAACQWVAATQEVEKVCGCRPVHSPYNQDYFRQEKAKNDIMNRLRSTKGLVQCTFSQEIECVAKYALLDPVNSSIVCPEDCEEVSFSSVVFGGRLVASDLTSVLPGDWEDLKEAKVTEFQRAMNEIPNHRIPVVREVQSLANIAQEFAQLAIRVFTLMPNSSTVPCLAPGGVRDLERALIHLKAQEPMWERITTYFRRSLFHELKSTAATLGVVLKNDGTINGQVDYVHNESMVAFSLLQLSVMETRTEHSFGLKNMDMDTRKKVLDFVLPFVREMETCLMKIHDNVDRSLEIALDCRQIFLDRYSVLVDAQHVYTFGQALSDVVADYISYMNKVVAALRRFISVNRVKILDWHNFTIELKTFETLYKDGGVDNVEILELMKLRKLIVTDAQEYITPLIAFYEDGLRARRTVLRRLGIKATKPSSLSVVEGTINCLLKISAEIPLLKKSAFIRGEWLSRVQRQVEIAQSYSATPQYDQINLLHVKLYFAHFKQERITQELSYNVFLLLAEIGGTIGLYVGATLLTVAETIVFFVEERTRRILVKPAYI